jgi:hypothetical protein
MRHNTAPGAEVPKIEEIVVKETETALQAPVPLGLSALTTFLKYTRR